MPREPDKRYEGYLVDIDDAAASALRYCSGLTMDSFLADKLVQSATLYEIMIVGEATKLVSKEFRAAHPEIPWQRWPARTTA